MRNHHFEGEGSCTVVDEDGVCGEPQHEHAVNPLDLPKDNPLVRHFESQSRSDIYGMFSMLSKIIPGFDEKVAEMEREELRRAEEAILQEGKNE